MLNFPEILTTSRFYLELHLEGSDERVDGVFGACSGFKATQETGEIVEVTAGTWGKKGATRGQLVRTKIPGSSTYDNLTLRRGLTVSTTMWNWLADVAAGQWSDRRRDGSLTIYDQAANGLVRFEFSRAWPVSYAIADLDVAGGDYEIETIELAIEALRRTATRNASGGTS